jgi:hypothetical protein
MMLHNLLQTWMWPTVAVYIPTTWWFYMHGRKKTSFMVDMIYAVIWLVWSITGPWYTWVFGIFWVWFFRRSYRRWKDSSNDDDKNLKKRLMGATSRVKAKLVETMRKLKPSPLPSPA